MFYIPLEFSVIIETYCDICFVLIVIFLEKIDYKYFGLAIFWQFFESTYSYVGLLSLIFLMV